MRFCVSRGVCAGFPAAKIRISNSGSLLLQIKEAEASARGDGLFAFLFLLDRSDIKWRRVMKSKLITFFVLAVGLVITCGPAFAHHGSGLSYKMEESVTVKGTVTNFRWAIVSRGTH